MAREEIPAVLVRWEDVTLGEVALFGDELLPVTKITKIPHVLGKGRRYLGVSPSASEYREYLRHDDSYATVLGSGTSDDRPDAP